MNLISILLAFGQGIGFKLQSLTDRSLQEKGASPVRTFALQRFALIPALLWSLVFVRAADVAHILHTPRLLFFFIAIAILWNLQSFLSSYVLNTVSTVSALSTLENLIYLPFLLAVGTYFNGDIPSTYSICGILLLLAAFILQPSHHPDHTRARFSMPIFALVALVFLSAALNAANNGISREALEMISPEAFLGIFGILVTSVCWMWTSFMPHTANEGLVFQKKPFLAAAIPLLWFAASIPETFAFAVLPIYTVVAIGTVTFALDTISDLINRRTQFNARTVGFIMLVVAGIGLAACAA